MTPLLLLLSLTVSPADAATTEVSEEAYERAVDLVERLYLRPAELDAHRMLRFAAESLADELHWLVLEPGGSVVYLRHGNGTPIGSVSVGDLQTLPEALRSLEALVSDSGFDVGDVDVRLEILKGAMTALDRYSRVLAGEKLDRFDVRLKGTLVGVGATIEVRGDELVLKDMVEGGPAKRGGLAVGDVILRIDGTSTVNMPLKDATNRIRGDVGTEVVLTVRRGTEVLEFVLARAEVVVENVREKVLAENVGYVRIDHFSQRTVENLDVALARLDERNALGRGLVIDLRGNTGGSMKEAARSADKFLSEGLLLQTKGPDGQRVQNLQARMDAMRDENEPPIPIVVLVDEQTASGSEILAGALLELDRAVLVGYTTYGKGTVQKIYNLDEAVRLKLTVAEYVLENDRHISAGGLVPDALLGAVEIDQLGVRYRGWEEDRTRVAWDDVVPVVRERGEDGRYPDDDLALEVARRTVLRANRSPTRDATLKALSEVLTDVREEQEARLVAAYEARGIDWSSRLDVQEGAEPVPPPPVDGTPAPPQVVTRVVTKVDVARPDVVEVAVEVENLGTEPLHRVLVELECDTFDAWSGLVIPVGRIEPGATGTGTVGVQLSPGIDPREDVVRVKLRSEDHPPIALDDEILGAGSTPVPRIALSARLAPGEGDVRRAEVTVENLSTQPIHGLQVAFAWPRDAGVELLDADAFLDVLEPREKARLDLSVRLGPEAPATLPLEVEVDSRRYTNLADWPIALPIDGSAVAVEAPRIQVKAPLSAPVGAWTLPVQVADERGVDHVVVYANGAKVAWAGAGRGRVDVAATIDLEPGVNRAVIVAEDDQGVVTRRLVVVRGETTAAVDADPEDERP